MSKSSSIGAKSKSFAPTKYNKPFGNKGNSFQNNNSKTNNFMKGKPATKPFKNI